MIREITSILLASDWTFGVGSAGGAAMGCASTGMPNPPPPGGRCMGECSLKVVFTDPVCKRPIRFRGTSDISSFGSRWCLMISEPSILLIKGSCNGVQSTARDAFTALSSGFFLSGENSISDLISDQ